MEDLSIAEKLALLKAQKASTSSSASSSSFSSAAAQSQAQSHQEAGFTHAIGSRSTEEGSEDHIPPSLPKKSRAERGSAPVEVSSQSRPAKTWGGFRASAAAQGGRVRARDPRFDEAAGELRQGRFREDYSFLVRQLEEDIDSAKRRIKKAKSPGMRAQLQAELRDLKQQRASQRLQDAKREVTTQWMEAQRERVKQGRAPAYLGKRERGELETAARYKLLREEAAGGATQGKGGVTSAGGQRAGDAAVRRAIKKRREKVARKDKKRLGGQGAAVLPPSSRNRDGGGGRVGGAGGHGAGRAFGGEGGGGGGGGRPGKRARLT